VGEVFNVQAKWQDYNVFDAQALAATRRLGEDYDFPLSTAIGVLGMPGNLTTRIVLNQHLNV